MQVQLMSHEFDERSISSIQENSNIGGILVVFKKVKINHLIKCVWFEEILAVLKKKMG